jgi:single-strand DNA-binding protein
MPAIDVTVVGNLARDPELKTIRSGVQLCTFTIGASERHRDDDGTWRDGQTSWVRCSAWRELGEHISATLGKGDRVIVTGRLAEREYEHNGSKRSSWEVTVTDAGPSLKFTEAKLAKATRASAPSRAGDPWQTGEDDAPPF